jgi:putative transposase
VARNPTAQWSFVVAKPADQRGGKAGDRSSAGAESFEPRFIRKGQKRFGGFDTKIIAMYAQGMTVREIKRFLEEQYKVEVSTDLISTVTDSVLEDVIEWQNRPLEPMYPVVFFDALRVKIRDEGSVKNKAVYLALGIQRDGTKDVLGIWIGAE